MRAALRRPWPIPRRAVLLAAAALLALLALLWALPGGGPGGLFTRQDQTWQAMQSRGAWRVGLDPSFPPFEYLDESGAAVGYDVELAHALAAEWGLEAEIVAIGFDSLLDAVRAGKVDSVVSAMPYDPRLTKDVAYSEPYFDAGLRLAVRAGSPLADVDDLAGAAVAVEWGSAADMAGRSLQREGVPLDLHPYETPDEALAALQAGEVDALIVDQVALRTAQAHGAAVEAVGEPLESNPYVIVMPKRAATLQKRLAESLAALQARGVTARLEDHWFAAAVPRPLDAQE